MHLECCYCGYHRPIASNPAVAHSGFLRCKPGNIYVMAGGINRYPSVSVSAGVGLPADGNCSLQLNFRR